MSDNSSIEWCDATWNPFRAKALREIPDPADKLFNVIQVEADGYYCEKVSPECANCYAEKINRGPWNSNGLRYARDNREKARLYVKEKTLLEPLAWKRPRRIFGFSMTDLHGEFYSDAMIDQAYAVMALAQQHTFLILTKRARNRFEYLHDGHFHDIGVAAAAKLLHTKVSPFKLPSEAIFGGKRVATGQEWIINAWPLPNVWQGVTAGTKKSWDERVDILRRTPAAKRFISVEPLLEDLGQVDLTGIDWVIVGGESGPNARPMHPDWARSLRDQCVAAGVAFHFKQWGQFIPVTHDNSCGLTQTDEPYFWQTPDGKCWGVGCLPYGEPGYFAWAMVRKSKKAAGRLLDGRTWDEFPTPPTMPDAGGAR